MKITWESGETLYVHLEAESNEERLFLTRFFRGHCKKLAKRFPLKDSERGKKIYRYMEKKEV